MSLKLAYNSILDVPGEINERRILIPPQPTQALAS